MAMAVEDISRMIKERFPDARVSIEEINACYSAHRIGVSPVSGSSDATLITTAGARR